MIHLTRQERLVLIFLVAALTIGAAVKVIRGRKAPPPPVPLTAEFDLTAPKEPASALAETAAPKKINVNAAGVAELCELPGVGAVFARRIVDYREEHGPFSKPEDLESVNGLGPVTVEKLTPYVTCEAPE